MAQKTEIEVTVNYKEAQKAFKTIEEEILLQKQITIEFRRELAKLEQQLAKTPKTQLAAQKDLKTQIDQLKGAITDQKLSLEQLNLQRGEAKKKIDGLTTASKKYGQSMLNNRGFLTAMNKLTGGLASQVVGVVKQFKAAATATKTFINALSGMQKALLTTGIGAIVVALGTIIAYWDEIKAAVSGVSVETSKLVSNQKTLVDEAERNVRIATSQDNILKEQGLSEIDIINYKREQTAELIKQIRLQIELNKQATEEAAKSAIKWGSVLDAAGVGSLKSFFGLDAGEIFTEGNKTNKELEERLNALLNTQAGYYQSAAEIKEREILKGLSDSERLAAEAKKLNEDFFKEFGITSAQAYLDSFNSHVKKRVEEDPELFSMFNQIEGLENAEFDALFDADMKKINDRKNAEIEAEALIREAKLNTLSTIQGIFHQDTAISKAAFAIKQLMALKEIQLSFKKMKAKAAETGADIALENAKGTVAVATGSAKAAATLNPFIIASYAVSAAAVIASMVSAFSKGKEEVAKFGGGTITGGRGSAPTLPQVQLPDFNVVGVGQTNQLAQAIGGQQSQPIKAYVVATDVTTAQSLERNTITGASI